MTSRTERRRIEKFAAGEVARGFDPARADQAVAVALARQLGDLLGRSKAIGNFDRAVEYLVSKVDLTLGRIKDVHIDCAKGCSHCCNLWVSATAPEIFYIAKRLRPRGDAVVERVRQADEHTRNYPSDIRHQHPHPCPMLENNSCSIYQFRPMACRMAASGDADICKRSCFNETDELIPTPTMHLVARSFYGLAWAAALKHSGLSHRYYEFNGALLKALERPDAERAWMAGEDVFAGALIQPNDPFDGREANILYQIAFEITPASTA